MTKGIMTQQPQTLQKIHWPALSWTKWLALLPVTFASVSKRVTEHNHSLFHKEAFSYVHCSTQNRRRMKYTQVFIRWVWFYHQRTRSRRCHILRIAFLCCFLVCFSLFLQEEPECDETRISTACKTSECCHKHGGWQRKWVPTQHSHCLAFVNVLSAYTHDKILKLLKMIRIDFLLIDVRATFVIFASIRQCSLITNNLSR